MTAVIIIEGLVIALLVVLVAGLLKSHAEILRRLDRLGAEDDTSGLDDTRSVRTTGLGRAPIDQIVGFDTEGSSVAVSLTAGRSDTLLCFLSTGCSSCQVFWTGLARPADSPALEARPVIVTKGPRSETPARVAELAPEQIQLVMSDEAWDVFRVPLTPYFMLLDRGGDILGEGSAATMERLIGLLRQSFLDSNPLRQGTKQRERFTDSRLSTSGIEPGDPSLYEDPVPE